MRIILLIKAHVNMVEVNFSSLKQWINFQIFELNFSFNLLKKYRERTTLTSFKTSSLKKNKEIFRNIKKFRLKQLK